MIFCSQDCQESINLSFSDLKGVANPSVACSSRKNYAASDRKIKLNETINICKVRTITLTLIRLVNSSAGSLPCGSWNSLIPAGYLFKKMDEWMAFGGKWRKYKLCRISGTQCKLYYMHRKKTSQKNIFRISAPFLNKINYTETRFCGFFNCFIVTA